jgi:hypothetical protein
MTLLILLVSIAVLERILRRPDPRQWNRQTVGRKEVKSVSPGAPDASPPTLAPSLVHLGRALEQFGRGAVPQLEDPVREKEII